MARVKRNLIQYFLILLESVTHKGLGGGIAYHPRQVDGYFFERILYDSVDKHDDPAHFTCLFFYCTSSIAFKSHCQFNSCLRQYNNKLTWKTRGFKKCVPSRRCLERRGGGFFRVGRWPSAFFFNFFLTSWTRLFKSFFHVRVDALTLTLGFVFSQYVGNILKRMPKFLHTTQTKTSSRFPLRTQPHTRKLLIDERFWNRSLFLPARYLQVAGGGLSFRDRSCHLPLG